MFIGEPTENEGIPNDTINKEININEQEARHKENEKIERIN